VQFKTAEGVIQKDRLKPAILQELRVLRRMLNVAARKRLLPANVFGGEFPVKVKGMFRPCYMLWSEQQRIEFQAPDYLRNIFRIIRISESGLRVYKELMGMKKEQVDLENAMVWIPDSKTPNGIAEVPLTELAREAFRDQIRIAGPGTWLFPSDENPTGRQKTLKTVSHVVFAESKGAILPDLRSEVDLRDSFKCGWCGRRMGDAVASPGRCEGVQELLADETSNEKGGATEAERERERGRAGF